MDTALMSLVLLICFIVLAFVYERLFNNGRSNKDRASRKKRKQILDALSSDTSIKSRHYNLISVAMQANVIK